MFKIIFIIFTFFLHFSFTACSSISSSAFKNDSCNLENIHFDRKNNFCATIRTVTVVGNDLIIGFNNGTIGKWDINTGEVVSIFEKNESFPILSIKQIHDSLYIGTASGALKQYGLQGEVMRSFEYGKGSLFVIDAESNNVYIGFGSGLIGRASVKDLDTIEIGEAHMYAVYDLKVDLENKGAFYSASDDNKIAYWHNEEKNLKLIRITEEGEASYRKIIVTKEAVLVGTGKGNILGYDKQLKSQLFSLNISSFPITAMVYKDGVIVTADTEGEIAFLVFKSDQWQVVRKMHYASDVRNLLLFKDELIILSKDGLINKISFDPYTYTQDNKLH